MKELIDPENQEDGIEALDVDSLLEKDRYGKLMTSKWQGSYPEVIHELCG